MTEIKIKVPSKENVKKVIKWMLTAFLALFLLMAIGRPETLMRILDKFSTNVVETKLDEVNIEKKELEEIIFVNNEYIVMYVDGSYERGDKLTEVAASMTDKTGKSYAVNGHDLVCFEDGSLATVEIHGVK